MKVILIVLFLTSCSGLSKYQRKMILEKEKERSRELKKIREHHSRWIIRQIKIRHLNERLDEKYGK